MYYFEPYGHLVGQRLSRMYLDKIILHLLLVCGLFGTAPLWAVELKEAEITALKNIVEHDTGEGKGATPAHASEKIFEKSKVSTAAASMAELTLSLIHISEPTRLLSIS